MKILLVDDDAVIRDLFEEFLVRKGHQVATASNGIEGASIFRHGEFDAVVSDYQMPRRNGILMIQEILGLAPEIRVVLMSADPPDARHIPAGVKVLHKPFRNSELLEALTA